MCHAAWRQRERHKSFHSTYEPEREEHHGHHERGERGGVFMPRHGHQHEEGDRFDARSWFGVRRPLRFLAHKLDLNEKQITELARILDELKTERAQAEVDDRRSLAEFSDAVAGEAFDSAKASSAGERRVQSAAKVRDTLIHALKQIHALLSPEQRQRLAYLIRTGVLAV
jgi:Spy/CpxP family protein refolding chaperone